MILLIDMAKLIQKRSTAAHLWGAVLLFCINQLEIDI